jgi:glycosyltransferase involved in cell wall biosynthesis
VVSRGLHLSQLRPVGDSQPSGQPAQEEVRARVEESRLLRSAKRAINAALTVVGAGDSLKGRFELRPRFDCASGAAFRASHGLEDAVVFGSVSRYFWIKNVDGLIRGFVAVARQLASAKLVVIGGGDRSEAMRLAQTLGLDARVGLSGPVEDITEAYAAFDVLVQPALAESFGQAIVEGMTMRTPVVATPVGIAPEIIEDGRSGFLAAGPEPAQLEAAMLRALRRRDDWAEIGESARQRALPYTGERWVRAHEDAYESWTTGIARREG